VSLKDYEVSVLDPDFVIGGGDIVRDTALICRALANGGSRDSADGKQRGVAGKTFMNSLIGIAFAIALSQQATDTVAVVTVDKQPAEIVSRVEAEAQFAKLCTDGTDDQRLRALAAALNPMPDWPQFVMNNEASVCNRNPKSLTPIPPK
jgi:hypothetical protein